LRSLLDDQVTFLTKTYDRDRFIKLAQASRSGTPDQWVINDLCEVRLHSAGSENAWSADCRAVVGFGGRLGAMIRSYGYSSDNRKLRSITEPTVFRALAAP